ncbi:hypothetical protein GSI_12089 [Ganoderma sinense ZZ0214-1]|uniref:HNH nuclease domain-containing protein n=1 Tax=Ganoderma sinense ZZ0214-1 TaxID=1077348 RepID=A0A2G8RXU0_9APHY|nr:hypothetical protein GSI_12089 [Ganoderma sinense ZZ0214-1]
MLTAEFTEAVDALIQDTSLSNKALKARALRYLSLLPKDKLSGPPWAQRIQKAIPKAAVFSTFHLFVALYAVADELKLVAGKRYVSATICACYDRAISAAPVGSEHENQSTTNLIQALDEVASTWAAFVLWPFYAHGADINLNPAPGETLAFWKDPPPRTESERLKKLQQRRWKEQVMARDNYYSFMCGRYDIDWFLRQPNPPEGADNYDCDVIRIIKREVFAQDEDSMSAQDVDSLGTMRGILERYFGADDALLAKAEGPQNMLFVNTSACIGFRTFTWCLHPTKTPNRYKIKSYGPPNYAGSRHVTSRVTFVDHTGTQSHSPSQPQSESPPPSSSQAPAPAPALAGEMPLAAGSTEADPEPVPLPDPALLRLHAALAGLLCLSGADRTFECLFARPPWLPGLERWPAPRGAAFWASVVEYEGEETCLEIDLHQSVEELWEDMLERAVAAGEYERRPAATNSREGSPSRHQGFRDGDACVSNYGLGLALDDGPNIL